jgi:4-amino-4-deoxy-L-arabinose transferase-like glycosyltransferase
MIDIHDPFQISAIVIFTIELIFIGIYFNDYGKPTGMYVSDILFQVIEYKVLMTIFVGLQTIYSLMFVFRSYQHTKTYFIIMLISVTVCLSGWIALNIEYREADGEVGDTHTYGTIVFMTGCVLYTALLLYTIRHKISNVFKGTLEIENILSICILVLMILCVIFGAIFVKALVDGSSDAWLFEHAAFMVEVMAHILFFAIETPNPWKPLDITDNIADPIEISPLLPATTLASVLILPKYLKKK